MSIVAEWEPEKYTFLLLFTATSAKQGNLYTWPIFCYFLLYFMDLSFPSRLHCLEINSQIKCACWMCYPPFYFLLGSSIQEKTQRSQAHPSNYLQPHSWTSTTRLPWALHLLGDAYSHSLLEQGLDSISLHWWVPVLNFASDDNGNA